MKSVSIGSLELGTRPVVTVIVDRPIPAASLGSLPQRGADCLEFRFDCFEMEREAIFDYLASVKEECPLPVIGTVRPNERTREWRIDIFRQLHPLIDAVDVELDASERDAVVSLFADKTVIVSEHDFESTPSDDVLRILIDKAVTSGADIVKLATMANTTSDVVRLLNACYTSGHPMVAIAMGEIGTLSRVCGFHYHSLFTFAFSESSVAPGQLSLDDMVRELERFYPGYRKGYQWQ